MKIKASRIGSPDLAEFIILWASYNMTGYWQEQVYAWRDGAAMPECPEGWTLLGMGCDRVTFQGPDGYAYKVPRYLMEGYQGSQQGWEWKSYKSHCSREFPEFFRLPLTWSYNFGGAWRVNVMECFGPDGHFNDEYRSLVRLARDFATDPGNEWIKPLLADMHYTNARVVDGVLVKIDLGI